MKTHHWIWFGVLAFVLLATIVAYDIGGFFSAPGLMQE